VPREIIRKKKKRQKLVLKKQIQRCNREWINRINQKVGNGKSLNEKLNNKDILRNH